MSLVLANKLILNIMYLSIRVKVEIMQKSQYSNCHYSLHTTMLNKIKLIFGFECLNIFNLIKITA